MANKTLNKTEFAEQLAKGAGLEALTKKQKLAIVDAQAALVAKHKKGGITIPGIVKIEEKMSKARMGRNPSTGEPLRIKAKQRTKARVLKALKDA